jgi:hypothetical protein
MPRKWRIKESSAGVLLVRVKKDLKDRFHSICAAHRVSMEQTLCKLIRQAIQNQPIGKQLFKGTARPLGEIGRVVETHPILSYYGKTKEQAFPLILVIGREPGTSMEIADFDGPYDFRKYFGSGFWNTAYGLIGESVELRCKELKAVCERLQGSPIIFGNSLPIGAKFNDHAVHAKRAAVSDEAVQGHIEKVFAFDLISRVRLVIMAGLHKPAFARSKEAVESLCKQKGIPVAETEYFCGQNKNKIREALTNGDVLKISEIVSAFLELDTTQSKE